MEVSTGCFQSPDGWLQPHDWINLCLRVRACVVQHIRCKSSARPRLTDGEAEVASEVSDP